MTDTAEYWFNSRNYFHISNGFRHSKGVDCGHKHNAETEYFQDVDCHACKKIITENRPDNLLDGEAPEFYYCTKNHAKKMRKAKKEREEFNAKYGVCDCGSNLIIRTNKAKKEQFLGCSTYPKCKKTKSLK